MENPQLENGYTRIANEIMEAFARTNFSSYQRRVLDVILRKTYGWGKTSDWVSVSQLVAATGIHKANISRAKRELIQRRIVICIDNKIKFNKSYSQWRELSDEITVISTDNKVISTDTSVISTDNKQLSLQTDTKEKKETTTKEIPLNPPRGGSVIEDKKEIALRVLEFFNSTTGVNLRLTSSKVVQINARLKTFTEEELMRAIKNRTKSPFHRGENEDRKVWYNDWDSLFRNDDKIEKMLTLEFHKETASEIVAKTLGLKDFT